MQGETTPSIPTMVNNYANFSSLANAEFKMERQKKKSCAEGYEIASRLQLAG